MKIKLGDHCQFYGAESDPGRALQVQRTVLSTLEKAGLKLSHVDTGMRGPDVWFEIADAAVEQLTTFAATLPEVGVPSQETNEEMGDYLSLPLILERRDQPHRRR